MIRLIREKHERGQVPAQCAAKEAQPSRTCRGADLSDHTTSDGLRWFRVLDTDQLPEGRVMPVTCGHVTVCMTRFNGEYGALDNQCPHQGGPLGEGSIENGWLRCPWQAPTVRISDRYGSLHRQLQ